MSTKATITIQATPNSVVMPTTTTPCIVRNPRYIVYKDFFRRPEIDRIETTAMTKPPSTNSSQKTAALILSSSPTPFTSSNNSITNYDKSESSKFRKFSTSLLNSSTTTSPSPTTTVSSDFMKCTVSPLERRYVAQPAVVLSAQELKEQNYENLTRSSINRLVRVANNSARRHKFYYEPTNNSSTTKSASLSRQPAVANYCWSSSDTTSSGSSPPPQQQKQQTVQCQTPTSISSHPVTIRNNFIDFSTYKSELMSVRDRTSSASAVSTNRYQNKAYLLY